jgi:hypothetical protein
MAWPTKTDFVDGDVLTAAQVNNIGTNLNVFNPTAATNGQILTADGSGSASFQTPTAGSITTITSGSLTGSALDLTSIPSTYKELELVMTNFNVNTINNWGIQFNGATGPTFGYAYTRLYNTTNATVASATSIGVDFNWGAGASVTFILKLPNYAVSTFQVASWTMSNRADGANGWGIGQYRDAQFIVNRIRFFSLSGATFTAGTYLLRGIN